MRHFNVNYHVSRALGRLTTAESWLQLKKRSCHIVISSCMLRSLKKKHRVCWWHWCCYTYISLLVISSYSFCLAWKNTLLIKTKWGWNCSIFSNRKVTKYVICFWCKIFEPCKFTNHYCHQSRPSFATARHRPSCSVQIIFAGMSPTRGGVRFVACQGCWIFRRGIIVQITMSLKLSSLFQSDMTSNPVACFLLP